MLAFILFGMDKRRAIDGRRRIREGDLLGIALFGGTGGAYLGRHHFRHKTRKQPFSTILHLVALMQGGVVIGLMLP